MIEIDWPAHSSYSQLQSYTTCSWRFYLERGLHIQGPPSWAMIGGSTVHQITADVDTNWDGYKFEWGTYFEGQIKDACLRAKCEEKDITATGRASKQWPDKRNRAWWEENGPVMVNNWINWRSTCPWEILEMNPIERTLLHIEGEPNARIVTVHEGEFTRAVEFEVSGHIGETYVKAFVDRAFVLPSGEVAVIDIKTGTSKPYSALQLGTYAVLMEKMGIRPTYGYFWMAEQGGTSEPFDLTHYTEDWLAGQFAQQQRGIDNAIFLPSTGPLCGSCGVRDYCEAQGGSRAHEIPAPEVRLALSTEGTDR